MDNLSARPLARTNGNTLVRGGAQGVGLKAHRSARRPLPPQRFRRHISHCDSGNRVVGSMQMSSNFRSAGMAHQEEAELSVSVHGAG